MRDKETLHKKLLQMIDCYATTDPLREMSIIQNEKDLSEASIKWLALAGLHGINKNASEISIIKSSDGGIKVVAEYRPAELPSPGPTVGDKIIQDIRNITHLEMDAGGSTLSFGVREGSIDIKVIVKKEDGVESVVLLFPY